MAERQLPANVLSKQLAEEKRRKPTLSGVKIHGVFEDVGSGFFEQASCSSRTALCIDVLYSLSELSKVPANKWRLCDGSHHSEAGCSELSIILLVSPHSKKRERLKRTRKLHCHGKI